MIIALLGGAKAKVNLNEFLRRRLTLTGSTLRPRPVAFKGAIARGLREKVWPHIESGGDQAGDLQDLSARRGRPGPLR